MGKLTVRAIESAKAKERPYKLSDGDGLQLRIASDGTKTWLVRYMFDGRERQYRLPKDYGDGEAYFGLPAARAEASKIRALARQGVDYQSKLENDKQANAALLEEKALRRAQLEIDNLTVSDLFASWIADGVRRKDGNAELQRSFKKDVLPDIGDMAVRNVTEHDIRSLLRKMVQRKVNRLAVLTFGNLMQMFSWAEMRQPWRKLLSEGNPVQLVQIEKIVSSDYDISNVRERILSADEITELRHIFDNMRTEYEGAKDKRVAARPLEKTTEIAIWIMLSTICRVGELSMTRWEHVNLESGEWFIPRQNTKGSIGSQSDLTVYLSPFTLDQFRELHQITGQTAWCFPAKNKDDSHVCIKSISKQVGDRQSMFKTDGKGEPRKPMKNRRHDNTLVLGDGKNGAWTPHDLRRTGATMMQSLGVSLEIIDRCQNHVLPGSKVRRHYLLHDYADEKRAAWRLLGDRLSLILNPTQNVVFLRTGSDHSSP
jgi:integrase